MESLLSIRSVQLTCSRPQKCPVPEHSLIKFKLITINSTRILRLDIKNQRKFRAAVTLRPSKLDCNVLCMYFTYMYVRDFICFQTLFLDVCVCVCFIPFKKIVRTHFGLLPTAPMTIFPKIKLQTGMRGFEWDSRVPLSELSLELFFCAC